MRKNADSEEARDNQRVIIGAGGHSGFEQEENAGQVGDFKLGPNAPQPYWDYYHAWFDYWLRDKKDRLPKLPPYLLYVMGEDKWHEATGSGRRRTCSSRPGTSTAPRRPTA